MRAIDPRERQTVHGLRVHEVQWLQSGIVFRIGVARFSRLQRTVLVFALLGGNPIRHSPAAHRAHPRNPVKDPGAQVVVIADREQAAAPVHPFREQLDLVVVEFVVGGDQAVGGLGIVALARLVREDPDLIPVVDAKLGWMEAEAGVHLETSAIDFDRCFPPALPVPDRRGPRETSLRAAYRRRIRAEQARLLGEVDAFTIDHQEDVQRDACMRQRQAAARGRSVRRDGAGLRHHDLLWMGTLASARVSGTAYIRAGCTNQTCLQDLQQLRKANARKFADQEDGLVTGFERVL